MKKTKKVLSFLTAAAMFCGISMSAEPVMQLGAVLTARAADATSGTCGENLTWEYDETTKTLTISGTGKMGNYADVPWLSYKDNIEHVSIEKGVTRIDGYAFANYSSLTSVTIPDSVTDFGGGVFAGTPWLEEQFALSPYVVINHIVIDADPKTCAGDLVLPESVTSIGEYAFEYCSSLTSVTIPDSVTSIGWAAFIDCSSLTSVTIPDSVTSIDGRAFESCSSLTSVTMPDSVTSFGAYAFNETPWLEEQLALSPYAVASHVVIASNPETCTGDLVLPENVTGIGGSAFESCDSLTSVTIPDGVTSIDDGAFWECTSLTSVMIPDSVTSIGSSAFRYCSSLTSVKIPDGVTSIAGLAFYGCSSLMSVTIPDSVTSIDMEAFCGCYDLTSITIPDSVTSIGDNAFNSCTSLTSVTIPDSVTSIGFQAFGYCSSLTSVTIPDSVTSIGVAAFFCCTSLTSVTIPDSVTSIEESTFENCSSLTSVTIPSSVTSIGWLAFSGCENLNSIIIENPDCKIYDESRTICNEYNYDPDLATFTGTIYGEKNSTAQAYAEKYGYQFKSLGKAPVSDTLGDVSGDGVINAGDAAMTLSAAAAYGAMGSYGDMTEAQITAADIDGNGMVNASDAAYILQYAAIKGANGKEFDIRELVK